MKFRLTRPLSLFALSSFLFTYISFAATLSLTKIGSLDLGGKRYGEWWYTQANPTLYGKTNASAVVTVKTNDKSSTTTANSAGDWSYPTTLAMGDHSVVISQGSEVYSFKLHITQTLPASFSSTTTGQTTQSSTAVPSTGSDQLVALGLGLGLTLLAVYLYISGDTSKKAAFERQFIKE